MATTRSPFLLILILFSFFFSGSLCEKQESVARKEDVPFIRCEVCRILSKQLISQIQHMSSQTPSKQVSEYEIIEVAENVCNLKKKEADWMLFIDIVENGDKLELVQQDSEGQCNSECKTIERACQEVMGYHDTDVAEYLFKHKPSSDQLIQYLCKDLSKACSRKTPPLPKDRVPGEPFMAKPTKEAELDKILKSMEGMPGASNMKMYSKDDLMGMKNFDNDDEEDEDEDEDELSPKNLGKVMREAKEKKKDDWKEKVLKGVNDVKQIATKQVEKVQKWWKGKIAGQKKSVKSSKTEF